MALLGFILQHQKSQLGGGKKQTITTELSVEFTVSLESLPAVDDSCSVVQNTEQIKEIKRAPVTDVRFWTSSTGHLKLCSEVGQYSLSQLLYQNAGPEVVIFPCNETMIELREITYVHALIAGSTNPCRQMALPAKFSLLSTVAICMSNKPLKFCSLYFFSILNIMIVL